jgi:diguanylate cyclase (GGDEF)-like protein
LVRVSLGLVAVTCSILVTVDLLGLVPSLDDGVLEARIHLCEMLAAQTVPAIERNDLGSVRAAMQVAVARNEDLLSAGLRTSDGRLAIDVADHGELWDPDSEHGNASAQISMPLFKRGRRWGTIEVRFERVGRSGWLAAFQRRPALRILLFVAISGFVSYLLYMRRTLRHLDPSAVIPSRVQNALDVMAEGVMLVDSEERIVLVNTAFTNRVGRPLGSLMATRASKLGWRLPKDADPDRSFPWVEAIRTARKSTGTRLLLTTGSGEVRSFIVNGAPVLEGGNKPKGAIVTLDDVTDLERRTMELEQALRMLEKSRDDLEKSKDEIRLRNEELQILASRDPLTDVANRRAFMETYERIFERARRDDHTLCCLMADIDHFKRVNDNHGHQMGDEIIRRVADVLKSTVRGSDAVCRYGGEEFCIVLVDTAIEGAAVVGERIRAGVAAPDFADIPVTLSLAYRHSPLGRRRSCS